MADYERVVLIMTDTQRHDMFGCYRQTGLLTPCIDQLAAEGRLFEQAYTTQPVCQPARAALFFGRYPHEINCWSNSTGPDRTAWSIGQRLQQHGVHTAYIGKWHLDGGDYFGTGQCPDGWDQDYWFDMRCYLDGLSEDDRRRSRQTETNREGIEASFTYASQCSDRAIRFLEHYHDEPFFLTVSYDEPHGPFLCPEPYASMYQDYTFPASCNIDDPLTDKPASQRAWAGSQLEGDRPTPVIREPDYFGCHSFVDSQIGRVVAAIRRHTPDACIIFTSDHGDFLHSHRLSGKGPAVYEEITHIPLIISAPGLPSGCRDHAPVSHINIAPTVFDLMGLPQPKAFSGKSLLPQLTGAVQRVNEQVFIGFGRYEIDHDGFGGFQPLRAAYDGRYKLAINLMDRDELYDLQQDPAEMRNLIDSPAHQTIRDRLHDAILDHQNETRDPFRGYWWERRTWRQDARPATWDYTGMTRQREEELEDRQLDYDTGLPMEHAVRHKNLGASGRRGIQ
ncbi:MAG: sulfatase-like hydrolase/transferase [Eubacteriales bacterium]|nr:sulfatase-like hydrolase/transferase [Eubacteriales bacterium]